VQLFDGKNDIKIKDACVTRSMQLKTLFILYARRGGHAHLHTYGIDFTS
jgi:hypothetical protein